jgi:S-adenosylmethionine synthetase
MMFGYAVKETANYMPLTTQLSHDLLMELAEIRRKGEVMTYLRPDSKSQVTLEYDDDHHPVRIDTIVISTQHDDFEPDEAKMQQAIKADVEKYLIPAVKAKYAEDVQKLFDNNFTLHVNPTGKFVIGGPHGDTGLTGRKIIVDTYGGHGAHGGGAFSGKDASKVDRSAAYATRHIAKNMVAAGVADKMLVQVAYAIGVAEPVGFYINTYGTAHVKDESGNIISDSEIARRAKTMFDLRPYEIVRRFGLKYPIFEKTASYGHFGRDAYEAEVELLGKNGSPERKEVTFFGWEKLDKVDEIKSAFGL